MKRTRSLARAALFLVPLLLFAGSAHAEVRALLVAASHFASAQVNDIEGPANDVVAMEAIARAQGATDITVLRDDLVSRTAVETALHALGLRTKPGDWVLFYYSGHGAQAPAQVKGTRDGDLDQFVPLPHFDAYHQDPERFIVDKDFYDWLGRYVPRSAQVLMIADTCHSGSMNRSVVPGAAHFVPRLALRGVPDVELIPRREPQYPAVRGSLLDGSVTLTTATPGPASPPALDREDLPNLLYIGAAQDDQLAEEMGLPAADSPSRGVLTYALEQGLSGRGPDGRTALADRDGDGRITIAELAMYLDGQVRSLTAERQQPRASWPAGREATVLFVTPPLSPTPPAPAPLPAIQTADPAAQALLAVPEAPWRVVSDPARADFVWDRAGGRLLRRSGDVVAFDVTGVTAVRGVVEKWRAIEDLRPLINESRAALGVAPQPLGARYAPDSRLQVVLRQTGALGTGPRYATVFDLAADGTVQPLYPQDAGDGDGRLRGDGALPLIDALVVPPFGTDHVVAVVSATPQTQLRAFLATVAGQRAAGRLVAPIHDLLATDRANSSVSIAEIYTGS